MDAAEGTAAFASILGNIQLPNLLVESRIGDSVVAGKDSKSVQHTLHISRSVDRSVSNRSEKLRKFLSRGHVFEKFARRTELTGGKPFCPQFLLDSFEH